MLRIYPVMLEWLGALRPFDCSDRAVRSRAREAASLLELVGDLEHGRGTYSRGGHRTNAYGVALREMGESYSALRAARVHGYIGALEPAFEAQCRRILGTLMKLALPAR